MSDVHLGRLLLAIGAIAVALGLSWWWLVFSEVIRGSYVTYGQAARCVVGSTDLCSLAQAICKADHFLGIKRYSCELFWSGAAISSLGLILAARARPA